MEQSQLQEMEKLYIDLYSSLYRYAYSCLHDESMAEEAVQEAFRIACGKPEVVLQCDRPEGWMIVAVRNVCRNMYRRRETDKQLLLDCFGSLRKHSDDYMPTEKVDILYGSLAKTPEFQLIKAIAIEGRTMKEIADQQGISLTACYKRIQRARKYLEKKLK